MPEGNYEKGKEIFKRRCAQCHSISDNRRKDGPTLHGIMGRRSGTVSNFVYTKMNKNKVGDKVMTSFSTFTNICPKTCVLQMFNERQVAEETRAKRGDFDLFVMRS
ncbi:hypothetical protein AB6A40_006418 [Gnathostoma spinigerum]|uniref:Cytochrome c domain-containing protein n=1 Tax=Gnathostoma spinigerum TaxID=75299 RepID=A0ABD6EIB7_9BILA